MIGPSSKIKKAVITHSKNTCAFPGCTNIIIDKKGNLLGEVCHIEAKSKGGPRYNKNQTNAERNDFDNLICFCGEHHNVTHDLSYSVEELKKMKYDAESNIRYNKDIPNLSYIYELTKKNEEFSKELNNKHLKHDIPEEFKVPFNSKAKVKDLIKDVEENLNFLEHIHLDIIDYLDNLNDNIIKKLEELGYDSSSWKKQFYVDNPFANPLWEEIHLGLYNFVIMTRYRLLQIAVKYYEEYLKLNQNDSNIKIEFEKKKKELEKLTESIHLLD